MLMNKLILIIRDGWGYSPEIRGNAIAQADLEYIKNYEKKYPTVYLDASGNSVGQLEGCQGNSEVGHLTIGAGRIIPQPIVLINNAIEDGVFFKNKVLIKTLGYCKKKTGNLHLIGLLSDGNVHSSISHLYALLRAAKEHNIKNVYVHAILDGRDVSEKSALKYINQFKKESNSIGIGKIVSVVGRYYAMDRDKNWDRTKQAFDLFVNGVGHVYTSPEDAIAMRYTKGDPTDYYIQPCIVSKEKETIKKNDTVIFFNFRNDRARQIVAMLTGKDNMKKPFSMRFLGMVEYENNYRLPILFKKIKVKDGLSNVLSKHKIKQLRIAETEKYAHITYFFNGQIDKPCRYENRMLIPSKKVPSYADAPDMSAREITNTCMDEIKNGRYEFVLVNFANADLVGHSGKFDAVIKGVKTVDKYVHKIVEKAVKENYYVILTGDHGNAEEMLYDDGKPKPSHTLNKVPFTLISNEHVKLKSGGLNDIAPTILELLKIDKPKQMTGESLIA